MSDELVSVEELRDILENGRDMVWVPVKGVPGLFIVRWPAMLGSPANLSLVVNPPREDGTMMMEIGYIIVNRLNLEDLRRAYAKDRELLRLLVDERVDVMVEVVESMNLGVPIPPDRYPEDLIGSPASMLRWMLEQARDWSRLSTRVPGVSILKVAATSDKPAHLAVALNPPGEQGLGLLLSGMGDLRRYRSEYYPKRLEEVEPFLELLSRPETDRLVEKIEEVNPEWLKNWRWGGASKASKE